MDQNSLKVDTALHLLAASLFGMKGVVLTSGLDQASIKFMYDTYAHQIPGQDEQAAQIFSARVSGHGTKPVHPPVSMALADKEISGGRDALMSAKRSGWGERSGW